MVAWADYILGENHFNEFIEFILILSLVEIVANE